MVHLSTCLILSTFLLLAQFSSQVDARCCPGDTTCSGCWLCPGSNLRSCWDGAVAEIDQYQITESLPETVNNYCRGYARLAHCWQLGRCCSEFSPLSVFCHSPLNALAGATNICNLRTWSPDKLTRQKVEQVVGTAYYVRNTIWHNDKGTDVPKLSVSVKAFNTDLSQSSHIDSDYSESSTSNKHQKSALKATTSSYQKPAEYKPEPTESKRGISLNAYHGPKSEQDSEAKKQQPKRIHHQANCNSNKPKKC
ncbi:uncharacterized protein VP01_3828g2 [Puccinia sorghi]|uniref:Uncharacterized protein n=1 Tax=Puccinia sorghi TaxID=27349 RepID=A0A0L6UT73_9BASI|nr:uncharacterized protein VP01_3828g2 [Puccinia sorghi]